MRPGNSSLSRNSNNNSSLTLRHPNSGLVINNNYNSDLLYFKPNNSGISKNNDDLSIKPWNSQIFKYSNNLSLRPNNSRFYNNNLDFYLMPNNSRKNRSNKFNQSKAVSINDERLSNIPENEIYKNIYSKDEYGLRKQFWEIMFKDWIEKQKEKEERKVKEKKTKDKQPRKRNKKNIFKSDEIHKTSEAIKNSNIFGKKMNLSYINQWCLKENRFKKDIILKLMINYK